MIVRAGDVVKKLDGAIEHGYDRIDPPVVVEISKCNSAVRGWLLEIRTGPDAYTFKPAISKIAEEGVPFRILPVRNQFVDVVENVGAGNE